MPLNKKGSPEKIKVIKYSGFAMDPNYIAEILSNQWPTKSISIDNLHSSLKQIGVINYTPDDLSILIGRLEAIDFQVTK